MTSRTSTLPPTADEFFAAWSNRGRKLGYVNRRDGRCPRSLIRKQCLNRTKGTGCWCSSRLNDHGATWTRHDRRLVLWEPYQAYPEDLAEVFAAAAADGIRVVLTGMSPYYPGGTVAIEFSAKEKP